MASAEKQILLFDPKVIDTFKSNNTEDDIAKSYSHDVGHLP